MEKTSMRATSGRIIAATAGALCAGVVLWWAMGRGPDAPPVAEMPGAVTLDGTYDLKYELTMDGVVAGGGRGTARVAVTGSLGVTPRRDGERRWLEARLSKARLELDEVARKVTDFPAQGVEEALGAAWVMELDPEGRAGDTRFAEGTSVAVRGIFAAVASMSQFVRPSDLAATSWTTTESEINGPFTANYEETGGGAVTKRWHLATQGDPEDPERTPGYESDGDARFELADGILKAVTASQVGAASVGRRDGGNRARFTTSIVLTRTGAAPAGAPVAPAALKPFTMASVPTRIDRGPARDFDEVVEEIRKHSGKEDWQRRLVARDDLTNTVVKNEAAAGRAGAALRKGGLLEPVERSLLEALAGAATPAAQRELGSLVSDDALPRDLRVRALAAGALMKDPLESFFGALQVVVFDQAKKDPVLASEASLTLGAATSQSLAAGAPEARPVVDALLAQARLVILGRPGAGPTASFQERRNWVGALGNLGADEALPILEAALEDRNELLRAAAARALRFLDPAKVLPLMQKSMRDDPSIHVRSALMSASRYIGPELLETFVAKALMNDESGHVRLGAAHTMATWSLEAPGLRQHLATALNLEKDLKVRESLENYLRPGRVEAPFREVAGTSSQAGTEGGQ